MAERIHNRKNKRQHEKRQSKKEPLENKNSFLFKLWKLVNDENISSIHWSQDGEKVVIENPIKFTADVLVANDKQLFKTKNISSFIRQLNLYGFRRIKENCGKIPLIFQQEYFKKDRHDLVGEIRRKKAVPQPLPVMTSAFPPGAERDLSKLHVLPIGSPSVYPQQYSSLPTCQPHAFFGNALGGKNLPLPYVSPFAVNHGPTFINLAAHSTVHGKSLSQTNKSLIDEDGQSVKNPTTKEELIDEKCPSRSDQLDQYENETQQHFKNCFNTSSTPQQSLVQIHGGYQKYPSSYYNTMFHIPQMNYPNLQHSMSNTYSSNNAMFNTLFHPYMPYPGPQFSNSLSGLPNSPNLKETHPEHINNISQSIPSMNQESKKLFTSYKQNKSEK